MRLTAVPIAYAAAVLLAGVAGLAGREALLQRSRAKVDAERKRLGWEAVARGAGAAPAVKRPG
ncbi:MAG: hypothetical protein EBS39_11895 [Gammaproteobacteria bacterium]|nr:hypothetical protein [Gammaproteobacteria bacterium]